MARNRSRYSHQDIARFFGNKFKLHYNSDDTPLNGFACLTKTYDKGTYNLSKKEGKLGAALCIETGYEKRKLD
jgi:hypothetical protein